MRYVLFVCTQNAGRSQMAQALFERHGPPDVRAESAGRARRRGASGGRGGDARDRHRPQRPYVPSIVEDWDLADPADQPLEVVRRIRDEVELGVKDLAENRIEQIREDRRQHVMRMARLVPGRVEEFGDRLTDEEIRGITDEILETYDEAPVRSFVMTLANRRARAILKDRAGEAVGAS